MAYTKQTLKHEFEISIKLEPINPKYEEKQYISGGFFLGCGFIDTKYKKELVSYDGLKQIEVCAKCGLRRDDELHNLIIKYFGCFIFSCMVPAFFL